MRSELLCGLLAVNASFAAAQATTIDKIVAVVADKAILLSDVEGQTLQIELQTPLRDSLLRCRVLEEMIVQKMLLIQAEKDSVTVSEDQVETELNKKLRYFIAQMGSPQKLEDYLGKSIPEIKNDFRDRLREQLIVQQMQAKITSDVSVSPAGVKSYFERIPADSLPFIESEIQVAQIMIKPPVNDAERSRVRKELQEIKQKILDGRSFASMAAFYSEDPGSAAKGGELGYINRGDMVPEFEAAAFALKGREISDIVETTYGFHIIQLIDRRGETINVRHILLSPKVSPADLDKARTRLDSITQAIRLGHINFGEAAQKYSDDADTRNNGGLMINPATGSTWFEHSQIDQSLFFTVDRLKIGEISDPVPVRMGEKREAYRIVTVKGRTDAHVANLQQDYQRIRMAAENEKRERLINEWINRKRKSFYIRISPDFSTCPFQNSWNNQ